MLTQPEQAALEDRTFLLIKKSVQDKILDSFSDLSKALEQEIEQTYPLLQHTLTTASAKSSRGENYLNLPYYVHDFPRVFEKKDILAFRTIIRWGHEISFNLLVAGKFMEIFDLSKIHALPEKLVYFCVNNTAWEHHFEAENVKLLCDIDEESIQSHIEQNGFFKLTCKDELNSINQLSQIGVENFKLLMKTLK